MIRKFSKFEILDLDYLQYLHHTKKSYFVLFQNYRITNYKNLENFIPILDLENFHVLTKKITFCSFHELQNYILQNLENFHTIFRLKRSSDSGLRFFKLSPSDQKFIFCTFPQLHNYKLQKLRQFSYKIQEMKIF